jgi:hypothetical protein
LLLRRAMRNLRLVLPVSLVLAPACTDDPVDEPGFVLVVPAAISFGDVPVGSVGSAVAVLENRSSVVMPVPELLIEGEDAARFGVEASSCEDELEAGGRCALALSVSPLAPGRLRASLVAGDAPAATALLVATATATLVVESTPREFGSVYLGEANVETFYVSNRGPVWLSPPAVVLEVVDATAFYLVENRCGGGLSPGDGCEMDIQFNPSQGGPATALLTFTAGNARVETQVTGEGRAEITIQKNGAGQGDIGGAVSCPVNCTASANTVTTRFAELTAAAAPGSQFVRWGGAAAQCLDEASCVLLPTSSPTFVTATFEPL